MQYQILVEHPNQNGFVASVIGVPDCVVTANTEEEAIASARQALQARLSQAKIVAIEVESPMVQYKENPWTQCDGKKLTGNPWIDSFGVLKDDPTFDDLMEKLERYRREGNSEIAEQKA